MAAPVVVHVDGARQLRATLRRAGDNLDDMRAAHARAAGYVAAAAGHTVPRRSGDLAASIRSSGTKTAAVVRAGYARIPYAGPIHWGWPRRHIRPSLFLTGAAASTETIWTGYYVADMQGIVDRIEGA